MITKFNGHEQAQAYMITNNGNYTLISYTTPVITISNGWLHVNGLYSATTRKHIGWLMREFGFTYQLAKQLFTDNMTFKI